mmetsp:Transcript_7392/g.18637  ORF Transcript_7392/g.18637 Transcript_7392/m.18637 type:complete len:602 (-) Transcript_7392:202-2007(-)|eukprot:CAMPEP_0183435674 /NCGR_PEP_ID=MMETSP0370-20130417/68748_1 /TAXON_ID=268820 /ORGANISM="Peridinium aciculiferum, Strain PAER-2" /LENGTH=601 /DNA_ID=CAMNT_0025622853 /DNA_START=61 /DNA_END=1866 /DNA_ORIENTATION=-
MAFGRAARWFHGPCLVALSVTSCCADAVQVHTSGGTVHGSLLPEDHGAGGSAVGQFLGVPFASAKRFLAPVDYTQQYPGGSVHAKMWGAACMQVAGDPSATYGSEDCLKANVWRPQWAHAGSNLPVMVFIYGGSNQFGEAEPYNMSALAAFHRVVCVSFNYRTGPIGWMAFQEDVDAGRSTGNWGILDIQSALRWVQREVGAFGGDAKRVAIHGQSSGAGLVELQYVAPGSKGLFSGAISESGSLGAQAVKVSLKSTLAVANSAGCLTAAGAVNKSCLATAPAVGLTAATYSGSWGPTTDGVTFPETPQALLHKGLVHDVTVVLGAQTNDSNLFLFRSFTKDGLNQPNDHPDGALQPLAPIAYKASLLGTVGRHFLAEALKLYPVNTEDLVMNVHQLGNIESDHGHCSNRQRASMLNRANPGRAFLYRFDYFYTSNSKCSAVPNFHLPYLGAAHQDEVTFVLGQPNFMEDGSCCGVFGLTTKDCPHLPRCQACYDPEDFGRTGYRAYFNDLEWEFAKTVGKFWTNVAASGNPNCREQECSSVQAWPSAETGKDITHNIVLNATFPGGHRVERTPYDRPEICDFWDRLAAARRDDNEQDIVV